MRCDRQNATITTAYCLKRQGQTILGVRPESHQCFKCPQGERAKKGELMDDDIEGLKEQLSAPGNNDRAALNRKVRESKKRMKEANRPDPLGVKVDLTQYQGPPECPTTDDPPPKAATIPVLPPAQDLPGKAEVTQGLEEKVKPEIPPWALSVEIAGQRIELCEGCARRYLRI